MDPLMLIIIAAGLLLAYAVIVFNELTKERIVVRESQSAVGSFLQQRNDVLPNMVEVVKGYAGHENKTLTEVTMWRNKSAAASNPQEQSAANAGLEKALVNLYSVAEQYPDLKANTNFMRLQDELSQLEEKINNSRRYYNGTVREYNQSIAVFPKNIVAGLFGFKAETFFAEEAEAQKVPKISFKE